MRASVGGHSLTKAGQTDKADKDQYWGLQSHSIIIFDCLRLADGVSALNLLKMYYPCYHCSIVLNTFSVSFLSNFSLLTGRMHAYILRYELPSRSFLLFLVTTEQQRILIDEGNAVDGAH